LHKKLVRGYFCNARHLLRPCGEIHVSHKSGPSYDKWDLEKIAAEFSLILVEKVGFQKAQYPGYNQKKGDGPMCDKSFPLGTCFTFKFIIGDLKKLKQQNRRRAGSVSSPPDSTVLTPTTLLPHVAVQRQPSGFALNFSMPGRLDALGTTAREYQGSLRREFEMLRQVMPGATNLTYSAFLEDRHRESVQRQEWLRRMIANSRQ
jgi:25S rRNA (uracil2634-N3)-methyltransferase